MKLKAFTLCAVAAALAGCNHDPDNNTNTQGSITLSGTPISGQTLSATVEDQDGITTPVQYVWYADGDIIAGATNPSFTLTDEQIGAPITVLARYTDDGGITESHITNATADVVAITFDATVTISGEALVGSTLSAVVGDENGVPDIILYTWFADDIEIEGETASTLTLSEAQFGKAISVNASFEDNRGFNENVTSAASPTVARVNTEGSVEITGTPTVGNTLTTEITDTDGATGTIAYQWFADAEAISGASSNTYVVDAALIGAVITVQVTYTDDNGFTEDNISAATITVTAVAVDQAGTIEITGTAPYLSAAALTATITDNNGVEDANVTYTWFADGVAVADSNASTFTPSANAGAIISVSAVYTDNDMFSDTVTDALNTIVYTVITSDEASLAAAVNSAANGDVVGVNTGVFADIAPLLLTSGVTIHGVEGETPVFSGEICMHVADAVDGAAIKGLTFTNVNTSAGSVCESNGDSLIYSEGDNFTFSGNAMGGDVAGQNLVTNNWLTIEGTGSVIERNTFSGRNNVERGAVIKLASSGSNHVIQYNLFENSDNDVDQSSLYLLNLGSTTGTDAANNTNFTVQYNKVNNFESGRRMMRVQTSGATIKGNTILDATGAISLEDGGFNTVSDNIIIRSTTLNNATSDRVSGVLLTPLGHTISNNYIAGLRPTGKETGGIVFTANPFSQADGGVPNSGNQAVLDGAGDFTLTVNNNTVLNSIQPIVFSTEIGSRAPQGDCDELTPADGVLYTLTKNAFVIDFDANLIANGLNDGATTQGLFLPFDESSSDHAFEYDCDLINHTESVFSNNYGFTDSYASGDVEEEFWVDIRNLNGNGEFDSDGAIDQDPAANGKEVPALIIGNEGLTKTDPNGAQAGAGANVDLLHYILDTEVGVGSTWLADSPEAVAGNINE